MVVLTDKKNVTTNDCFTRLNLSGFCLMLQHGKDGGQTVLTKLRCAAGLADLATKKYKSAAKYFLLASFDYCDFPEVSCRLIIEFSS